MDLSPHQWEIVKTLFEEALDRPPAERGAFLAAASADPAVRSEVERLLAHHVESGGFLSNPAVPAALNDDAPAEPPQASPFQTGVVVADRFRITRFIARGGMGEVYEAEDVELHERVALKSIRGELLHNPKALDRFKREVQLARKVTHPNVCRIFDLFRQSGSIAGTASVAFVAMELLEGETLAQFLRRQSRINLDDARPIAIQMAAGLGAAHSAGVLHRDFKPGNVVLVPGKLISGKLIPSKKENMRAVITDFGLALRATEEFSLSSSVTGTGEILGTPAYMSPEQVEGKELTPASDVYSLGLVLYQMATGIRAFEDATPLSMAVRRIKEDPVPPRTLVPDIDRHWESIILKCLQREPKARYQNGDEVASALRHETPRHGMWILDRRAVLAIVAIALLAGGILIPWLLHSVPPLHNKSANTQPIAARPSVAVLPFQNLSGRPDTAWVSTALPEMLTAELTAGGKLRTFPRENITRASTDLKLNGQQTLAGDTLKHLRKYLGTDYVVLGSYLDQGAVSESQIRVDLWLQDAKTGEIAATVSEKGSDNQLDDLVTRVGADLRQLLGQKLGVGDKTPVEAAAVRASLPSVSEAVRPYSEGLAKLRLDDAQDARDLLQTAVDADPNFALGHSALAQALQAMGYAEKAQEESKKARELSAGLSREERLWIEGRDYETNRQWEKAVESYRTLFEFYPDNVEYGLRLASAQAHARTVDEALATLAALRRLPAPDRDDPRIDLQQAEVYEIKGAYKEQQAAAEAAVTRARDLGANLLLARALNQQARAFEQQGKLDDALRTAEEAAQIADSAKERLEVARALTIIGIVHYDQGDFAGAVDAYKRALAAQREIGNERGAATTLNNLANAMASQGDLSGSARILDEALQIFQRIGDKHSAAAVLNNLATRSFRLGDLKQAKIRLDQALAISQEIGDQERASMAVYNLGEVLRWQGDLKGARKMYEQAKDLSQKIGDQSGVAYASYSLGDISMTEGNLSAALESFNQALALRNQIGERGNVAETQLAMANLVFNDGDAVSAESTLRTAREEFRKQNSGDDEILADISLAHILLSQGRIEDAQKETSGLHDLLAKTQDFSVRIRAAIVDARLTAAAGKSNDAIRSLQSTIATASKAGYLGYQLEAQLALGEVLVASGRAAAGNSLLAAVHRQAQQRGYRLIMYEAWQASHGAGAAPSHGPGSHESGAAPGNFPLVNSFPGC